MHRFFAIAIFFICGTADAQNWVQVFSAPAVVTSAFFFNESEGVIGTGRYEFGTPALIYYTNDGGSSWSRAILPNSAMKGQVTDIFFRDRLNGWASIAENAINGWGGLYRTTDGGRSWQLWYQADFIVGVREISKGIFYTDRLIGVFRSTDGGASFQNMFSQVGTLGLDFLDDNIGIVAGEGNGTSPILITTNGGASWSPTNTAQEGWTSYADPASKLLFIASEHDFRQPPITSVIALSNNVGKTFSEKNYTSNSLTGGIAGPKGCKSTVYVQGQGSPGEVDGLMRSTDLGATWVPVGGPSNWYDTRFAVTGRGAVVFAFDKGGGVWRTRNGGDGKISSSVFPVLTIESLSPDTTSASVCDSVDLKLQFSYSECDSLFLNRVDLLDDVDRELRYISVQKFFGKNGTVTDSLTIRYKPKNARSISQRIRLRFIHTDRSFEDTTMTFIFEGRSTPDKPLLFGGSGKTIDFGSHNICSGDSTAPITISNAGCTLMNVTSISTSGSPFTLLSTFQPFTLDPGASRKFLVRFKPSKLGPSNGIVRVITTNASDSLALSGIGIEGSRGMQLVQSSITSTICDSVDAVFTMRNLSCSPVVLDSLSTSSPFTLLDNTRSITIPSDSFVTFRVRFKSGVTGNYNREVRMYSTIAGQRFDTVLFVNATATDGAPILTLSDTILDLGNVSTCGFKDMTVTVTNSGCGQIILNSNSLDSADIHYSLRKICNGLLNKGETCSFIIRFSPQTIGLHSSILHISTTLGTRDVTITGIGTSDPGILSLTASSIPQILTCSNTTFLLTLLNGSCDSAIFDSLRILGIGSADYSINTNTFTSIQKGSQKSIIGLFTPSLAGDRSATIHFYFHTPSGSLQEVSALLTGSGVTPVPIIASMPITLVTGISGKFVSIPITMSGTTIKEVSTLKLSFECNASVFTPIRFEPDQRYVGAQAAPPIPITNTLFEVTVTFAPKTFLQSGTLGQIVGEIYLSDSLSTQVILRSLLLSDANNSSACLPSNVDANSTRVELDAECGDLIISKFIGGSLQFPLITSLKPNPTSGAITITFRPGSRYDTGEIGIYDALGICHATHTLSGDDLQKGKVELMIEGTAGLRFIQLRTPQGIVTARLMLVK